MLKSHIGSKKFNLYSGPQYKSSGATWTPATPSGLIGWYKADVGVGGSSWADQSGLGNNMAPNGFSMPTTSTLNGKPSLVFVNNSNQLRTASDSVTIGTSGAFSVFMLASISSSSAGGPALAGNGEVPSYTSGAHSFSLFLAAANFSLAHSFGNYSGGSFTTGVEQRYGITLDPVSGNVIIYVNGAILGSPAALAIPGTSPCTLSAMGNGGDGNVREIIFYDSVLGTSDLASMDAYLVSRT